MIWKQLLLVSCLSVAIFLSKLQEVSSALVDALQDPELDTQEAAKQIFVPEKDAMSLYRWRARRSPRSQEEIAAENRQHPGADEQQIENYEERRYEKELVAEQPGGQARSQEANGLWRRRHHSGLRWHRHHHHHHN